jgi:hypothetical protein
MPNEDFDTRVQGNPDDTLLVKFEVRPKLDQTQTEKEGRPIYRDVEYVDIRVPGSPDHISRPATPHDKDRFPRHYAAFKNRTSDEEYIEGTRLDEWPLVSRSTVEELAFFGVKTVEQLASVNDANIQQRSGMASLKQKAKEWLEIANKSITASQLKAELDKRDQMIAELKAQLEAKPKTRKKKVAEKKEE